MNKLIVLFILSFYSISSFACKSAVLGNNYPIHDFTKFSNVITAKIISSKTNSTLRYNPLISLEATVIANIKGKLPIDKKVTIYATEEEPHAVCPLHFNDNEVYLLLLESDDNQLMISRFSFPINSNSSYFNSYINQIRAKIGND